MGNKSNESKNEKVSVRWCSNMLFKLLYNYYTLTSLCSSTNEEFNSWVFEIEFEMLENIYVFALLYVSYKLKNSKIVKKKKTRRMSLYLLHNSQTWLIH
jgi:hypothetical protein